LALKYHELSHTSDGWAYTYGGKPKRLYGGSLLENIVQALARIVVMDTAVRVRRPLEMMNVRMALQVHDELIYVPPEDLADYLQKMLCVEMRVRPSWAPDLPLDAEAGQGMNYAEAK
jgi:DNA polymerase